MAAEIKFLSPSRTNGTIPIEAFLQLTLITVVKNSFGVKTKITETFPPYCTVQKNKDVPLTTSQGK